MINSFLFVPVNTSPVCLRACLAKCSLRVNTMSHIPNPVQRNNFGSDLRMDCLFFCGMGKLLNEGERE